MVGRRELILRGFSVVAAVALGDVLAACAPAAVLAPAATAAPSPSPMPPPETKTIRIALGACDAPQMISERYLQEEGFADIQLTDAGGLAALTGAKADLASLFVPALATAVDSGKAVVGLGGLHTGCAEMWAPPGVATLQDLRGHTVVVNAKTPDNLGYSMIAMALKNAGVDPSEVTFVVQADADLTKSFLDGKSDLLFLATTGAFAFGTNPANKGHLVLEQAMDAPWSQQDCCVITTTTDWLKANPVAAKRALRAIYRAADTLPKDRADAAKVATDKGLFGGSKNVELVRGAANMVPYDWRTYDVAASMRFHAQLLNAVSLIKFTPDEAVTKATDLRFAKELAVEIKR